jgi:hypothetical protein
MRKILIPAALLWALLLPAAALARPLSVTDVARLADNGAGEEIILAQIEATGSRFDLDADDIIFLKKHAVSDRVISAMIATSAEAGSHDVEAEDDGAYERDEDDDDYDVHHSLRFSLGYHYPWRSYDYWYASWAYPWWYFYYYPTYYYSHCHPYYYTRPGYWHRYYRGGYCDTRTYVRHASVHDYRTGRDERRTLAPSRVERDSRRAFLGETSRTRSSRSSAVYRSGTKSRSTTRETIERSTRSATPRSSRSLRAPSGDTGHRSRSSISRSESSSRSRSGSVQRAPARSGAPSRSMHAPRSTGSSGRAPAQSAPSRAPSGSGSGGHRSRGGG